MSIEDLTASAMQTSLAAACSAALAERERERRAAEARERAEQTLWATTEGELLREAAAAAAGTRLSEHFADPDRWQVEDLPDYWTSDHAWATAVVEVEGVRLRYSAGRGHANTYAEQARLSHLRRCPESGSTHPDNWRTCEIKTLADLAELLILPAAGAEFDRRFPRTSCGDCWRLDEDAPAPPAEVDVDGFEVTSYGAVDQVAAADRALVAMRRWIGRAEQAADADAKHLTVAQCAQLASSWALVALLHGAHLDILTCPHPEA